MGYDYDQTHDNIIKSAREQFIKKGFSGASIRQICKDAGVTNGAFYAHFDSKEDLFATLVGPTVRGIRKLYEGENQTYMDMDPSADFKTILEQTFTSNRVFIRYVYENADIFKLLLTAAAGTEYEDFADKFAREEAANTKEFFKTFSSYTDNAEKLSEEIIRHISILVVSTLFDGLLEGKTEDEVVRESDLVSEFCLAGLKHILDI
ncbi:MAG: TetR/AcrR family transcriptional regulator [Lachnospiraceae bacterium]|nr:TetR/AcrR family transcriptional regulator [Lachnospiraceae bacterium]